jgi:hypothetical protein
MRLVSQSGAPFTLRLDQQVAPLEDGLRFQDAVLRPAPVSNPAHKPRRAAPEAVSINVGMSIARLVFTSQLLIVILLGMMVFGMVFLGVRASSNMNYYYALTAPYLNEVRDRGMNMVRNADASGGAMAHMLREADGMASSTLPALARSMNESVAVVDRLTHLARNPVMKISME